MHAQVIPLTSILSQYDKVVSKICQLSKTMQFFVCQVPDLHHCISQQAFQNWALIIQEFDFPGCNDCGFGNKPHCLTASMEFIHFLLPFGRYFVQYPSVEGFSGYLWPCPASLAVIIQCHQQWICQGGIHTYTCNVALTWRSFEKGPCIPMTTVHLRPIVILWILALISCWRVSISITFVETRMLVACLLLM